MIDKVGAIIIKDGKMLVARENGKHLFFIPGGRREGEETDEQCLRREIREELGTSVKTMKFYKEFVAKASLDKGMVKVRSYFCKLENVPTPCGEIEELTWIDSVFDKNLIGNVLKAMIPHLKENGHIN